MQTTIQGADMKKTVQQFQKAYYIKNKFNTLLKNCEDSQDVLCPRGHVALILSPAPKGRTVNLS
jgi:hypothetical protein